MTIQRELAGVPNVTPEPVDADAESGLSIRAIASATGDSIGTVHGALSPGVQNRTPEPVDADAESGLSIRAIASATGDSRDTVHKALNSPVRNLTREPDEDALAEELIAAPSPTITGTGLDKKTVNNVTRQVSQNGTPDLDAESDALAEELIVGDGAAISSSERTSDSTPESTRSGEV